MEDHAHLSRQAYHRQIGLVLADLEVSHPWGCVVVFYAAYHSARWALQCDQRFNDMAALKAINPHLVPELKNTAKHKTRGPLGRGPEFGVNDLVALLYPAASPAYEKLHQASIEVRYEAGRPQVLPPYERLVELVDEVHAGVAAVVMGSATA